MKKNNIFIFFCLLYLPLCAEGPLEKKRELFYEYAGKCIGEGLRHLEGGYNMDAVIRGLKEAEQGKYTNSDVSEEEFQMILEFQTDLFTKISTENLHAAEAFLNELANKPGVKAINEKLLYEQLQEGRGNAVLQESSEPLLHYSAKLIDGTEIVNTFKEGEPMVVPLIEGIVGFVKGTIGMKEGEQRRIYMHPDLAYKKTGSLPPNSLLILECEVVKMIGRE